jgi:predicted DNA binding protein
MAAELGISPSAFSMRLRKAERGVFEQLFRSI